MKIFVAIAFVLILGSLASALFHMLRGAKTTQDQGEGTEQDKEAAIAQSRKMVRALTLRVAISVSLFLIILLLYWLGYIEPTGIPLHSR